MMPRYRLFAVPAGGPSLRLSIDLDYPTELHVTKAQPLRLFGPREEAPADTARIVRIPLPSIDLIRLGQVVASGALDALITEVVAAYADEEDYDRIMAARSALEAVLARLGSDTIYDLWGWHPYPERDDGMDGILAPEDPASAEAERIRVASKAAYWEGRKAQALVCAADSGAPVEWRTRIIDQADGCAIEHHYAHPDGTTTTAVEAARG